MKTYHKIQTVWLRDPNNRNKTLLEGRWAKPEFEYLQRNEWFFEEKVNGTNVRVLWYGGVLLPGTAEAPPVPKLEFRGKTDNAQMPPKLLKALQTIFTEDKMQEVFGNTNVCLYGEGYGVTIQKGGGNYRADQGFILFDVLIGEWWLQRPDVEDIAQKLNLDIVPIILKGTLHDMVAICREGFQSTWGDFSAEGLVGRPAVHLFNRKGERVITKLKCKDFSR